MTEHEHEDDRAAEARTRREAAARRAAAMPVMTPLIKEVLGLAKVIKEDGGIALVQGDSGVGKTEAVKAITLKHQRVVVYSACTARARMKPMLEDLARVMAQPTYYFDCANLYRVVADALPARAELLV